VIQKRKREKKERRIFKIPKGKEQKIPAEKQRRKIIF